MNNLDSDCKGPSGAPTTPAAPPQRSGGDVTITLTEAAATQVRKMLDQRGTPDQPIRIGVTPTGCSGYAYKLEYANGQEETDKLFTSQGVDVVVDEKSMLFMGDEILMDFVSEAFKSGFVFTNPNEKSRCGCGESFSV